MRTEQIALQLYTVRDACARDFLGTLRAVAAMGYSAVELAGLYNTPPEVVRATLDELGMRACSAHIGLDRFEHELPAVIAELHTLGCAFGVVPWVPPHRRSAAAAKALAADLNRWGSALRAEGLRFGYHHHDFEFHPLEGSSFWALLTEGTDPALVELEIDVYWARRGGHDPAALIAEQARRVALVHLKDLDASGDRDAPAGEGTLAWEPILAAARAAEVAWYIVEQDHPRDPLDDVRRAREQMALRVLDAASPAQG